MHRLDIHKVSLKFQFHRGNQDIENECAERGYDFGVKLREGVGVSELRRNQYRSRLPLSYRV